MNIIKTGIVAAGSDVFWEDNDALASGMQPRPVLILVQAFAPGSQEAGQLRKMLDASGLTADQYNTVELAPAQQVGWQQLRERLQPRFIFMVGVMPAQLGITALFQAHAPNNFNGCVWLPTLSIAELEQQPEVKKQLWLNGMKPMFKDKAYGEIA